jgi:hypothetical protein
MNKTYITIALLSPLACTAAMGAKKAKASNQQKPNVIIILADDLGYGDLGCYGAKNVETPNVDKLAKQGIRFTDAHAIASTSTPSRYSLLTGEYAWRKPGTDVAPGDAGMIIKPTQFTMADMFKSVGYSTCAIGKWHLGLGAETGKQDWNAPLPSALADIGFDHHYIMAATADRVPCVFIEDGKVANYDASAPIEVSYYRNFPGEPTGKDNPELCYMSDNIGGGGNWDFWTTTSYGVALDKARLFRLDYRLWFNGLRRKDFDIAYDDNSTQLCYVLRTELGNSLYFKYQKDKLSINLGGKVEWKHGTSDRSNFEKLNAYDFEYGGNMTYTLPLGISLSTDLKEYCRRGYSEKSFNTSDLVWNASLARSFCKGKLTLKAEAFDILQNLSSTVYEVGGQGKTEKWNNTLPSYAMLHLMYKFSKAPKNKK